MEYVTGQVASYLFGPTNHSIINHTNLYNFVICVFDDLPEDQRKAYITKLKMHVGMSFCDGLKHYIFRKDSKHAIIEYLT